jgi:hypothetical protein
VPLFGLLLRLLEWMSPQMAPSLEIILHSRKPQTNAGKEKKYVDLFGNVVVYTHDRIRCISRDSNAP